MKTASLVLIGLAGATLAALGKAPAKTPSASNYVAHEWGTFTSVQGHDGMQLEWNPFVVSELPEFVYDARKLAGRNSRLVLPAYLDLSKTGFVSRQRMETPVIYFYSDEPRKVDVDVQFPEGRFTEWFPRLSPPKAAKGQKVPFRSGTMRWADVEILAGNGADEAQNFPKDESGSHYYAARDTDASAIRVKDGSGGYEYDKFLFYRGVAQFTAPLQVSHWGDHADDIRIHNTGKLELGPYFIYAVRGEKAALVKVPALGPGVMEDVKFRFEKVARPAAEVRAQLANELRTTLVSEGLYEREAAAMVKTWEDSWFGEQGLRVLYTLPQKWADEVLPLKITPAPKELKRVFVGRAEVITPAQEWALLKEVVRYAEGGTLQRREALATVENLGLGRFLDAAARHLSLKGTGAREFNQALWGLIDASKKSTLPPPSEATTTARR